MRDISVDLIGEVGVFPRVVRINTSDAYATVVAAGYLSNSAYNAFQFYKNDLFIISYLNAGIMVTQLFTLNITNITTLTLAPSFVMNSLPVGQVITNTQTSATPGTVRTLTGKMVESATVMTSGNVVGLRGEVDCVGASGGFLYGVQGKVLPTGTISSSAWVAGVFGQLDLSGATLTSGQTAPIWADYGTTATAGTYTGARMYAGTNTTAAILNSQIYLFGGATNLLELNDNTGLVGATYCVAAGTAAGSPGNSTHCAAQKVLTCSFNGSAVYIPLFTQNS